jgi:hypothetical protein
MKLPVVKNNVILVLSAAALALTQSVKAQSRNFDFNSATVTRNASGRPDLLQSGQTMRYNWVNADSANYPTIVDVGGARNKVLQLVINPATHPSGAAGVKRNEYITVADTSGNPIRMNSRSKWGEQFEFNLIEGRGTGDYCIMSQWHQVATGGTGASPMVAVEIAPAANANQAILKFIIRNKNFYYIGTSGGLRTGPSGTQEVIHQQTVNRNQWYRLNLDVRSGWEGTATLDAWLDGTKIKTYAGRIGFEDNFLGTGNTQTFEKKNGLYIGRNVTERMRIQINNYTFGPK